MADYPAFEVPLPDFYQQALSTSLDAAIDRPAADYSRAVYDLGPDFVPLLEVSRARGSYQLRGVDREGFAVPSWADNLFGHIVVIPSRLALGNVLSNQSRTLEVANLFLEERAWESLSTDVIGLVFVNPPAGLDGSPGVPFTLLSFGSYLLQVTIAADGPASIRGTITIGVDVETVLVPVTGQRVVVFQFRPLVPIQERLKWATDVLEAEDGSEQRVSLREAPRQEIALQVLPVAARSRRRIDALLFDWLSRQFVVPIWWEARNLTSAAAAGGLSIQVPTDSADFRVGGLVLIYGSDEEWEALEVTTIGPDSLGLASELQRSWDAGAKVMPMRRAYAKTVPTASRQEGYVRYGVEFTTVGNVNLEDLSGLEVYDGRVVLDDCNLVTAGEEDAFDRPVIVLDNVAGQVYQVSLRDRSRLRTAKHWELRGRSELWRVRQLLHALRGSQVSFWLPSYRADMQVTETIGPNAESFRVEATGWTLFVQNRRPMGDVRLVKRDGTVSPIRRILGAETDGDEEVITIDGPFDAVSPIPVADILRVELVHLVRIADDEASILHRFLGDARVEVRLVGVKE